MLKNAKAFSSFSVDDLVKAKEFYSVTLGLESNLIEDKAMGLLHLNLEGSSVMIYPKGKDHVPATFTVLNFIVERIEEVVNSLTEKGITFEQYTDEYLKTDEKGISRNDGASMAWFKDPAGNILSLIEEKKA